MPLPLSADQRFPLTLKGDERQQPADGRPAFYFRYANGAEWIHIAETADALQRSASGSQALKAIYEILRTTLVGWVNMRTSRPEVIRAFGLTPPESPEEEVELPFAPEHLAQVTNPAEAKELLEALMKNISPQDDEKKA
jgi:hypothetical protein